MFQVALAGHLPDDEKTLRKLDEELAQIRGFLSHDGEVEEIRFLFIPTLGSDAWWNWMKKTECPVSGYRVLGDERKDDICEGTTYVDTPVRSKIAEMILDQVDLLLMVWNEDVMEMEGASWELLRATLRKSVPCLWVSVETHLQYWVEENLYVPYQPEKLREICEMTIGVSLQPEQISDKGIPLLSLGTRLYKNFLRHYKAAPQKIASKEDRLLQDQFVLQEPFDAGEPLRKHLYHKFQDFDRVAITANDKYNAVLYWRAILPFFATIFLVFGSYSADVLSVLPVLRLVPWWEWIAGFGFLISALINLYVFLLSRSKVVQSYHHAMVHNRRMAELLRVVIHFAPFGVNLDIRKLSGKDFCLGAAVRRMIGEAKAPSREITREGAAQALGYVEELLSDQISYHSMSCERFSKVVKHLEKVAAVMFYVGFITVLLRGGLQFVLAFMNKGPTTMLGKTFYEGVKVKTFISSATNMLAMILPAWAAYFAAKLSLGNFRFNRDNHQRMKEKLTEELHFIEAFKNAGKQLSSEALQDIGEGIAEVMLIKDNEIWANKYRETVVQRM